MTVGQEPELRALPLPADLELPLFTYGLLQPRELACSQIARFVACERQCTVRGSLYVRDGIPLFTLDGGEDVPGHLVEFREQRRAYEAVVRFEPAGHYEWATVRTSIGGVANALIGKNVTVGSEKFEEHPWTGWSDPVLVDGVRVVQNTIVRHGQAAFESAPPQAFDWDRFFTLQMAYLLLWSAIERYCALSFGPSRGPVSKVHKLSESADWKQALQGIVTREHTLLDSRDANMQYHLGADDPQGSALYYYQVRNNLSHRGKAAWRDGEIVRKSLLELADIFAAVLSVAGHQKTSFSDHTADTGMRGGASARGHGFPRRAFCAASASRAR